MERKRRRADAPPTGDLVRQNRRDKRRERFLAVLTETASVTDACKIANLPRPTAYVWRNKDLAFRFAWDQAYQLGLDALEDAVMRRALVGNERPVFHKGEIVGYVREPSDILAMFMLKSRRREIYGDRKDVNQITVSSLAA